MDKIDKIFNYIFSELIKPDYLKHFFLGALIFRACSFFLSFQISFLITLTIAVLWEISKYAQAKKNNTIPNDPEEMAFDIFYTVLAGMLAIIRIL